MKRIANKYNIKRMYPHSEREWISTSKHAEVDAVSSANGYVEKVIILRIGRKEQFLKSKPCNICRAFLEDRGIEEIVYYNGQEFIEKRIQ